MLKFKSNMDRAHVPKAKHSCESPLFDSSQQNKTSVTAGFHDSTPFHFKQEVSGEDNSTSGGPQMSGTLAE